MNKKSRVWTKKNIILRLSRIKIGTPCKTYSTSMSLYLDIPEKSFGLTKGLFYFINGNCRNVCSFLTNSVYIAILLWSTNESHDFTTYVACLWKTYMYILCILLLFFVILIQRRESCIWKYQQRRKLNLSPKSHKFWSAWVCRFYFITVVAPTNQYQTRWLPAVETQKTM